jgi:polyhydroxybutyrate depolymerase
LRHEHGLDDGTYPMEGRPIADTRQGAVRSSIQRLVADGACAPDPRVVEEDGRTCEVWEGCADGGEVWLCLHPGGHLVTEGWAARALAFLD